MRLIRLAPLVLLLLLATACGGSATVVAPTDLQSCGASHVLTVPPYASTSPFNRPIARSARVDPKSAPMVRALAEIVRGSGFVLSVERWTVPVYVADKKTPRYDVQLTASWAHGRVLRAAPIPHNARPDPGGDGHLAVVDPVTGCEYDFYAAKRKGSGWTATWANTLPLTGDGIFHEGISARASGFGLLAGLIFPDELKRGEIRHALVFSSPLTRAGAPVVPATLGDGPSRVAGAMPFGARVRLDPTLDVDSLDLPRWQRTIARALQKYGMYLGDTGGAVSVYAVHPQSYDGDPYPELAAGNYAYLDGIPLERLQVMRPTP